jgi:hypothetical protein
MRVARLTAAAATYTHGRLPLPRTPLLTRRPCPPPVPAHAASAPGFGTGATSRATGGYSSGPSSPPVSKSVYAATPARPDDRDSPGSGGGAQIDGKQFFQVARSKLSYEQFSQFLHNIKELNAGRQNRDETLSRVRDIFGYQHHDLFGVFEQLLNKAATSFGA